MKKILMALVMGFFVIGINAQADPVVRSVRFEAQSEAEMNAIPSNKLQEGSVCYREDTDSLWRYNGVAWAEMSGAGISDGDKGDITVSASGATWNIDAGVVGSTEITDGDIDETDLDVSVNASLDLADSSVQPADLSTYVTTNTAQTITGQKTFSGTTPIKVDGYLSLQEGGGTGSTTGYGALTAQTGGQLRFLGAGESFGGRLAFNGLSAERTYQLPNASGTIALTSDLSDYVDKTSNETIGGNKTFSNNLSISGSLQGNGSFNLQNGNTYLSGNRTGSGSRNTFINSGTITTEAALVFSINGTPKDLIATATDITYDGTSLLGGGGSSLPVDDTTPLVQDPVDNTKTGLIDVGNVPTATSATLSVSNNNEFVDQVRVNGSGNTSYIFEENGVVKGQFTYVPAANYLGFSNSTSTDSFRLYDAGGAQFFANLTANSFIINGSTSDDVLLGDGTTTSLAGLTDDQTLSEVLSQGADASGTTITNLGAPSLANDAARKADVDAISVPFSGINKTTDFTIADAEIGQIINAVVDAPDSIVVTYPNNLTNFGFTKFVVKGTGFVAFDMSAITTTGGSFKTQSGRGESATVRNYSATEADVLNPNQLLAYVPVVLPTELFTTSNWLSITNEADASTGISRTSTQISSAVVETTIVQDGTYSAKFTFNTTGTNSFATIELPLDGNGTYDLSFWVNSTDGTLRIGQITNTDKGEEILSLSADTWTEINVVFTVSNGASTASLEIGRGVAAEDFYLDAVSLTKQ